MAEEKIRVLVAEDPCKTCKIKPCQRKCMFAVMYEKAPGRTRKETIEKLGEDLRKWFFKPKEEKPKGYEKEYDAYIKKLMETLAEKALDSLLEGN